MNACLIFLLFSVITLRKVAAHKGYYDCSDADCSFFDHPDDPRNPYMDLYLSVECGINESLSLPSWKMGLEFYDGYLLIDTNEFMNECTCPVILKADMAFVTFHAYDDLSLRYSYKFPMSEDKDGAVEIFCEYNFSALLMNETNRAPMFLKVEISRLHIISFILDGIPLKWIYNLPEKYYNLVQDAIQKPVKKLIEDRLLQAFNEGLNKLYSSKLHGVHDNSVL